MRRNVVIVGNGIAGITAARHIRKRSNHRITVISAESDHFFSRTALMYIYMGHMTYKNTKPYEDHFWSRNDIGLRRAFVHTVRPEDHQIDLSTGESLPYDILVIATGSKSNKFNWPGQDLPGVQGLYSLQDLDQMERYTQGITRATVVGGGLIGVEMTEMLRTRQIPVSLLVREASWMDFAFPSEESDMVNRHIREHGVDLRLSTELERLDPDSTGRVGAVVTKTGERIDSQFVGLTVGVGPNIGFLGDSGIECQRGVLVDRHLRTSAPDVFAIGDCAQLRTPRPGRRPVEALWYTGRMMGETVAHTICGEPTEYDPGIWFNSAKFFDIEYQVYGTITPEVPSGQETLYWEHHRGKKSIRITYDSPNGPVRGFNLMGIRYRHDLCHEWLRDERPVSFVLQHLGAANFDPEFFAEYEREVVALYNARHPGHAIKLRHRRGLRSLFTARTAAAGVPS